MARGQDTVHLAAGATREITFRLDRVGNFFYWAALKGLSTFDERFWLDSQLTGALVVDSAGAPTPSAQERVWLITEWFYQPKGPKFRVGAHVQWERHGHITSD
jgi:hypothetical protein